VGVGADYSSVLVGRVFVFVQGSAEAVASSGIEVSDSALFGDRFGCGTQWRCLAQRSVWTVSVVVGLELA